jgi:hypothetical protein
MRNRKDVAELGRVVTLACFGAAGLAWPAAAPAAPLDPPADYRVQGAGEMYVRGSRCCGDTRFTGHFEGAYSLTSSGEVILNSLRVEWDDRDIVVTDGFLGLFSTRVALRCPSANQSSVARGTLLGPARGPAQLRFMPGVLKFGGASSEERDKDGACGLTTLTLASENNAPVLLTHEPLRNRFAFTGRFLTPIEGETYALDLNLTGSYANRPPESHVSLLSKEFTQGSCPARQVWNGQQWEWVANANDPRGWVGEPFSYSFDRDGPGGRADIHNDLWYRSRGAGARVLIGDGVHLPEQVFEWGPRHTLELLTVDFAGASSVSTCQFRVVDGTPPVVTPPKPLSLSCTVAGGVTPASSPELQTFLAGATATDLIDSTPEPLTPQLGGAEVTPTTLFPADNAPHAVAFRFRDDAGNVGSASSTVTIVDGTTPTASLRLTPSWRPANRRLFVVTARITANDDCGGPVTIRLVSIKSNVPALDAADIVGANFGTDDRRFYLRARSASWRRPRIYLVTYEARDMAGNTTRFVGSVVVGGVR